MFHDLGNRCVRSLAHIDCEGVDNFVLNPVVVQYGKDRCLRRFAVSGDLKGEKMQVAILDDEYVGDRILRACIAHSGPQLLKTLHVSRMICTACLLYLLKVCKQIGVVGFDGLWGCIGIKFSKRSSPGYQLMHIPVGHFFLILFLTCSGGLVATIAIADELRSGELALRGLVHGAILCYFAWVILSDSSPLAVPFATIGCILTAYISTDATDLSHVCFEIMMTAFACGVSADFSGSILLAVIASARTMTAGTTFATMTQIFHRAFLVSLAFVANHGPTRQLFVFATVVLAVHGALHDSDQRSAAYYLFAALFTAFASSPDLDRPASIVVHDVQTSWRGGFVYTFAAVPYVCALLLRIATTARDMSPIESLTTFVHVGALTGALWGILPALFGASPRLRYIVAIFPIVDAILAMARKDDVYMGRMLGALSMCAAIVRAPVYSCLKTSTANETHRCTAWVLGMYMLAHATYVWTIHANEDAMHFVFHTILIGGGLTGSALHTRDDAMWRTALGYMCIQTCGSALVGALKHSFAFWCLASVDVLVMITLASLWGKTVSNGVSGSLISINTFQPYASVFEHDRWDLAKLGANVFNGCCPRSHI
jgi:hypothetical protein